MARNRFVTALVAFVAFFVAVFAGISPVASAQTVSNPTSVIASLLDVGDVAVFSVPGTDDADGADMLQRTANVTGADPADITTVMYSTGFGVGWQKAAIQFVGAGSGHTYNSSVAEGIIATHEAIAGSDKKTIVLVGQSQGARVLGDTVERIGDDGVSEGTTIVAVLEADPRYPVSGLESWFPDFIPGIATTGPRVPSEASSGVTIVQVCIQTDTVCGSNPYSASTWFYLIPGFLITHSHDYADITDNSVVSTKTIGNTTYMVLAPSENPWGALLRLIGVPVSEKFDATLTALVPYNMPGERTTVAGIPLPLPREIQQTLVGVVQDLKQDTQESVQSAHDAAAVETSVSTASESEPVSTPDSSPTPVVVEEPVSLMSQEPAYTAPEQSAADDSSSQPESPAPATSAVSPQGDMADGGSDSSAAPHDAADDSDSGSSDSDSSDSGSSSE